MKTGAAIIAEPDGTYSLRRASEDGHGQVILTGLAPRHVYRATPLYEIVTQSRSVIEDANALHERLVWQQDLHDLADELGIEFPLRAR